MSPVVHREQGFTFYFVLADLGEPPHVHVGEGKSRRSDDARLWLDPVRVARPGRFTDRQLARILCIAAVNQMTLLEKWNDHAR
mgnify:CR=1 FL=1